MFLDVDCSLAFINSPISKAPVYHGAHQCKCQCYCTSCCDFVVSHAHMKLWEWGNSHTFGSIFPLQFFWAAGTEAYSKFFLRLSQQVACRSFWQFVPRQSSAQWPILKACWLPFQRFLNLFLNVKAFGEITLLSGTKISRTWFYAALPRQELRAIHTFQTMVMSRGSHP